jgi:REP element-mobilizing transposase RayT
MARKLRVQYPGAIYHVLNRGDRRETIFRADQDRVLFIDTLAETCQKTGWQVHALCLMSNHFHLVLETPNANLVAGMKWFLGTYTSRFNRRHKLFGHLFSGRYKSLVVDGSGTGYLRTVVTTCISTRCEPGCWGRNRSSGVIAGAVTRRICCRGANGPFGCG